MKITKKSFKYPQIDAAFRWIIDNIDIYKDPLWKDASIYEFGVGSGSSTKKIISYTKDNLHQYNLYPKLFGFDSFEGLPVEKEGVPLFTKFTEGSYQFNEIKEKFNIPTSIQKCWFNEAKFELDMNKALLVHIDCDLYISTKHALDFLIKNNLIVKGTIIAYDEFYAGNSYSGEALAHNEIREHFWEIGLGDIEVWHNLYYDKDTRDIIKQNVFWFWE